jgi:hypothetical protein
VVAELVGAQVRVRERPEAVEHHVAEIEEPTPADDHVEAEGQHHEEDGVEGDEPPVAVRHAHRHECEERDEQRQPRPPGDAAQTLLERPERPAPAGTPLAVTRDPFVAADLRARRALGGRRLARTFERPVQIVVAAPTHLTPS